MSGWTTKPPKSSGWYWVRETMSCGKCIGTAEVRRIYMTLFTGEFEATFGRSRSPSGVAQPLLEQCWRSYSEKLEPPQ